MILPQYNSAGLLEHYPFRIDQVVVLGGGRWARVIAGVLYGLLPENTSLTMCSPHGYDLLAAWTKEQGFDDRVSVAGHWPDIFKSGQTAVIVANATRNHATAAHWAIEQGAAVLVEKPLAVSLQEAQGLANYASRNEGLLAAAHVFRFARYLTSFAGMLPSQGEILAVTLEWVDPAGERRYGEAKQYDPSVPVYMDCLPHAVSVLQSVLGVLPEIGGPPIVEAGGSRVTVPLSMNDYPCLAIMQRNGLDRLRRLKVKTACGTAVLDFSKEPGVIQIGGETFCGDPFWDTAPHPLTSLIEAFLSAASGGNVDSRLNLDTGLTACTITESVTPTYQATVLPWLINRLMTVQELDDHVRYALAELLLANGRLLDDEFESQVARLRQRLQGVTPITGSFLSTDDLRRLVVEDTSPNQADRKTH